MGEMMWALVKEKADVGLWMKKVPVPMVGKNDVKIKIHKTAICGSLKQGDDATVTSA